MSVFSRYPSLQSIRRSLSSALSKSRKQISLPSLLKVFTSVLSPVLASQSSALFPIPKSILTLEKEVFLSVFKRNTAFSFARLLTCARMWLPAAPSTPISLPEAQIPSKSSSQLSCHALPASSAAFSEGLTSMNFGASPRNISCPPCLLNSCNRARVDALIVSMPAISTFR